MYSWCVTRFNYSLQMCWLGQIPSCGKDHTRSSPLSPMETLTCVSSHVGLKMRALEIGLPTAGMGAHVVSDPGLCSRRRGALLYYGDETWCRGNGGKPAAVGGCATKRLLWGHQLGDEDHDGAPGDLSPHEHQWPTDCRLLALCWGRGGLDGHGTCGTGHRDHLPEDGHRRDPNRGQTNRWSCRGRGRRGSRGRSSHSDWGHWRERS